MNIGVEFIQIDQIPYDELERTDVYFMASIIPGSGRYIFNLDTGKKLFYLYASNYQEASIFFSILASKKDGSKYPICQISVPIKAIPFSKSVTTSFKMKTIAVTASPIIKLRLFLLKGPNKKANFEEGNFLENNLGEFSNYIVPKPEMPKQRLMPIEYGVEPISLNQWRSVHSAVKANPDKIRELLLDPDKFIELIRLQNSNYNIISDAPYHALELPCAIIKKSKIELPPSEETPKQLPPPQEKAQKEEQKKKSSHNSPVKKSEKFSLYKDDPIRHKKSDQSNLPDGDTAPIIHHQRQFSGPSPTIREFSPLPPSKDKERIQLDNTRRPRHRDSLSQSSESLGMASPKEPTQPPPNETHRQKSPQRYPQKVKEIEEVSLLTPENQHSPVKGKKDDHFVSSKPAEFISKKDDCIPPLVSSKPTEISSEEEKPAVKPPEIRKEDHKPIFKSTDIEPRKDEEPEDSHSIIVRPVPKEEKSPDKDEEPKTIVRPIKEEERPFIKIPKEEESILSAFHSKLAEPGIIVKPISKDDSHIAAKSPKDRNSREKSDDEQIYSKTKDDIPYIITKPKDDSLIIMKPIFKDDHLVHPKPFPKDDQHIAPLIQQTKRKLDEERPRPISTTTTNHNILVIPSPKLRNFEDDQKFTTEECVTPPKLRPLDEAEAVTTPSSPPKIKPFEEEPRKTEEVKQRKPTELAPLSADFQPREPSPVGTAPDDSFVAPLLRKKGDEKGVLLARPTPPITTNTPDILNKRKRNVTEPVDTKKSARPVLEEPKTPGTQNRRDDFSRNSILAKTAGRSFKTQQQTPQPTMPQCFRPIQHPGAAAGKMKTEPKTKTIVSPISNQVPIGALAPIKDSECEEEE